jgi:heat-inducible transcriptional repressor
VLVVLVLEGARLRQQLLTFDKPVAQAQLTRIANRLNKACAGLSRAKIEAKKLKLSPAGKQVHDCLLKIMQGEDGQEFEPARLDGLHFTLNQPEFRQGQRVLSLMELVEGHNLLKSVTPESLEETGVQVIIGKENRAAAIQDCSVVISRYGLPDEAVGIMGVVGPTRMPYGRTISTVGYLSSVLNRLVAELYGRKPKAE